MEEAEVNKRTETWMKEEGWGYVQGVMRQDDAEKEKGGDFRVYLTDDQWVCIDHFGRRNMSGDPDDVILIEDMGNGTTSSMLEHFYRLCHAGEVFLAHLYLGMGGDDWEKFRQLLPHLQTVNPLIADRITFLIHLTNGETQVINFKGGETAKCQESENLPPIGEPKSNSGQSALSDFQPS